jgi:hypothetical protein
VFQCLQVQRIVLINYFCRKFLVKLLEHVPPVFNQADVKILIQKKFCKAVLGGTASNNENIQGICSSLDSSRFRIVSITSASALR